jgi:hypothetical protein
MRTRPIFAIGDSRSGVDGHPSGNSQCACHVVDIVAAPLGGGPSVGNHGVQGVLPKVPAPPSGVGVDAPSPADDPWQDAEMTSERLEVQRTIAADPATIFRLLCDPQAHVAIDSSGML